MSFVRDSEESWLQGEACRNGRSGAWKVDQARLLAADLTVALLQHHAYMSDDRPEPPAETDIHARPL